MTTIDPEIISSRPLHWALFCAAIDNFGDIGVCWRLARQLCDETGAEVELWVDDWEALKWFLQATSFTGDPGSRFAGVTLYQWQQEQALSASEATRIAQADVVVEAFACELPSELIKALQDREQKSLWLNLEYLSAESWVRDCHQLPSLQGGVGQSALRKYFFFPGFVEGSGGVLREAKLLSRHARWQADIEGQRERFLENLAILKDVLPDQKVLWLSLFTYEGQPLLSLLNGLVESDAPTLCLVPQGRSLQSIAQRFALPTQPEVGRVLHEGNLWVVVLPFMGQEEYDHLLSLCDFNCVRGEDSFVRAQFAARPMLWHLYPQEDSAHLLKLEAFLALYSDDSPAEEALKAFWRGWNQGEDCRELWHYLRPQLPSLQSQARRWQQQLAEKPDLLTNLLTFYREQQA